MARAGRRPPASHQRRGTPCAPLFCWQISNSPGCYGMEASAYIDYLTLGAVLYSVLRECSLDVANFLERLVLTVTRDRLSIVASGTPFLPNIVKQPGDDEGTLDVIGGPRPMNRTLSSCYRLTWTAASLTLRTDCCAVLDGSSQTIVVIDGKGIIQYSNDVAMVMLRYRY